MKPSNTSTNEPHEPRSWSASLVASDGVGAAAVTLLSNGELHPELAIVSHILRKSTNLDTLALGERDPGLLAANDEDVALTGSELVVNGILDVDDVETTVVALTVGDDTNTTHVTTTGGHGDNTSVEADEVGDLASGEVNLDGVVDLDGGVGVADTIHQNSVLVLTCVFFRIAKA